MSHLLDHYPFLYLIMNKLKLPWKLKTYPNLFSTELIYLGTVKSRVLTRVTNSKNIFGQRSQYISIEIPLHYQSEKDCMCFKTRWASTRDYTVLEIKKITLTKNNLFFNSLQRGKEKEVRSCLLIFFLPQFNLTKFKRIYFFFCFRQNDHIG